MDKENKKYEDRYLTVNLTDEEIACRAQELASVCIEIDKVAAQKKDMANQLKLEDDRLQARKKTLSSAVHTHREGRDVRCFWDFDWTIQMKYLFREDTGECVERYPLSEFELQQHLPFTQGNQPDKQEISRDKPEKRGTKASEPRNEEESLENKLQDVVRFREGDRD
jgi:hypothetical protein